MTDLVLLILNLIYISVRRGRSNNYQYFKLQIINNNSLLNVVKPAQSVINYVIHHNSIHSHLVLANKAVNLQQRYCKAIDFNYSSHGYCPYGPAVE